MQLTKYPTHSQVRKSHWQSPPRIPSRAAINRDIDLGKLHADTEMQAIACEYENVALVLSDPTKDSCSLGVAMAYEWAGLRSAHFSCLDLSLIYQTAVAAKDFPLDRVLVIARRLLQTFHFWNPETPSFSKGPYWSNESLANLCDQYPGPTQLVVLAPRLIELRRRQIKAAEHYAFAKHLLELGAA